MDTVKCGVAVVTLRAHPVETFEQSSAINIDRVVIEWSEEGATDGSIEADTANDEDHASPSELELQPLNEEGHTEDTQRDSCLSHTERYGSPLLEVLVHNH